MMQNETTESKNQQAVDEYEEDWDFDMAKIKEGMRRLKEEGTVLTSFQLEPSVIEELQEDARKNGMTYEQLLKDCIINGYLVVRQLRHRKAL